MNNEYMRIYMLKRYHQRRSEAIEFLGGRCTKCDSTENLEIDHINPTEKKYNIGKIWSYSKDKFWAEIKKCQLLCKTCHKNKSDKELRVMIDSDPFWGVNLKYR